MKTLAKIPLNVIRVEFIPETMEENTLYISYKYQTCVHLCLCGCKNKSVTPFGNNSNGWILSENNKGITLTPSILNINCPNRHHYIITNNVANVC